MTFPTFTHETMAEKAAGLQGAQCFVIRSYSGTSPCVPGATVNRKSWQAEQMLRAGTTL